MGLDFAVKGLVAVAIMVLILDGNSEHVRTHEEKLVILERKKGN